MKQKYLIPQIGVIELKLGKSVLTEQSGETVPTGGEGDNSRSFRNKSWDNED